MHLLLGWNSCERVLRNKVTEILDEKPSEAKSSFTAVDGYGAYFRRLAPTDSYLGHVQPERLDEEIALSLLRQKYKPKEIAKAIKERSPNAKVFVKPKT